MNSNSNTNKKSITKSINVFFNKLMELNIKIINFKKIMNDFKKVAMKYNINYVHVYHHLLFTSKYLNDITFNTDTNTNKSINNYMGKELISFYIYLIDLIQNKIKY